jgi:RimJ/RimL family protein N-acetyltransferase
MTLATGPSGAEESELRSGVAPPVEAPPIVPPGHARIRPMELTDFDVRIAYFHEATDEHLNKLGVDRSRLPHPDAWRASFEQNLARPLEVRSEYGIVWELDGSLVGFSTADQIRIGDEAHMHLHIIEPERRASGLGTQFVCLTAAHLCDVFRLKRLYCEPNAFNVAPNRTLQRAGFRYVRSREVRPNPINTYQTITIWVYVPTAPLETPALIAPPR